MDRLIRRVALAALVLILTVFVGLAIAGPDVRQQFRYFSREKMQQHVGTAAINSANATWTNWSALVTVTPDPQHALMNARAVVDLDLATTGWATRATSATIQFTISRKIDGTNWRSSTNLATAAISGTNSSKLSIELVIGDVGPTEQVAVYAIVSSAAGLAVTNFPYVLYYESGVPATLTLAN